MAWLTAEERAFEVEQAEQAEPFSWTNQAAAAEASKAVSAEKRRWLIKRALTAAKHILGGGDGGGDGDGDGDGKNEDEDAAADGGSGGAELYELALSQATDVHQRIGILQARGLGWTSGTLTHVHVHANVHVH